jgi:hypothetical protein
LVLMSPLSPGPRLAVRVICGEEMVPRAVVDVALIAGAADGGVETLVTLTVQRGQHSCHPHPLGGGGGGTWRQVGWLGVSPMRGWGGPRETGG